MELTSVRKGLDEVTSLKTQMQLLETKVNGLAAWKHVHVAEHANLKLSFEQHVACYDCHVEDTTREASSISQK